MSEAEHVLRLAAERTEQPAGRRVRLAQLLAVGNAYACPARRPKRSIRRLRIAKAAWSETCCAVIEVTSVSNGSGESGGRKPASSTVSPRKTGSSFAHA